MSKKIIAERVKLGVNTLAAVAILGGLMAPAAASEPWDGPFGLEMGLTADQLTSAIPGVKKISEFSYSFSKAPKHYPGTDVYVATLGSTGLCRITAISIIESSDFGDQVKKAFNETKNAISSKYGDPTSSYDSLRHGSIWSDPRDWMRALSKGERSLVSFWIKEDDKEGKLNLPESMSAISLETAARTTRAANVSLSYDFSNIGACIDEINAKSTDAL